MQALGSTLVWGPPLLFCLSPMYVDHQTQADESSCLFGLTWSVAPGRERGLGDAAGVYGESSGRLGQGKPAVFLVCLCWAVPAPSGCLKAVSPSPLPEAPSLKPAAPHPVPGSLQADVSTWAASQLRSTVQHSLYGEFSPFCLQSTCLTVLPSEVSKLLWPVCKGVSYVWKPPLLMSPFSRVQLLIPKSFVSFFPT